MPRNIALLGAARSGKDTVASRLVSEHGYQRLAFADPLKDMALAVNPLIPTIPGEAHSRLVDLVNEVGWDNAKTVYPEVRRILQTLGQGVRDVDPDTWIRALLPMAYVFALCGLPIVVTDVRYRNEADTLKRAKFTLIRVTRPDLDGSKFRRHASETDLSDYEADHTILNDGPLSYLYKQVETLTA